MLYAMTSSVLLLVVGKEVKHSSKNCFRDAQQITLVSAAYINQAVTRKDEVKPRIVGAS